MSASNVSRNRDDYPRSIQILIEAGAEVLFGGDIDRAWEAFFAYSEREAQYQAPQEKTDNSAILHLRATPRSGNPRSPYALHLYESVAE